MTDVGARLRTALGEPAGVTLSTSDGGAHGRCTVDLPGPLWAAGVRAARDALGCDFFDWLSAVDQGAEGFAVVVHVWSTAGRFGLVLRTTTTRDTPAVASVADVYPGADWPEREAHEMFGIDFPGHPRLAPLLLAPQFDGYPLRKEFVLASRVVRPWPGAVDPTPIRPGARARAPMRPPGVPPDVDLAGGP